ncbi:hypothetical protein BRUCa_0964 [Brucella melitensis]|nr:hypothetical protein BM28_A0981 [Brucella melitensis M28]AEW13148.1 hypothetical protein BCA52141_I0173 [Brucella canis HSK A52141]AEW17876.1 hypothetical protein BAA13334_I02422 [Brucella abortus A13334]AIB17706.1 Hypothetical protein BSSP3_I0986 [Brucella suis bv. 2]AIB20840.1 Hypothetical protein BSPT1_I0741 [Brucella suis bv. 2]
MSRFHAICKRPRLSPAKSLNASDALMPNILILASCATFAGGSFALLI